MSSAISPASVSVCRRSSSRRLYFSEPPSSLSGFGLLILNNCCKRLWQVDSRCVGALISVSCAYVDERSSLVVSMPHNTTSLPFLQSEESGTTVRPICTFHFLGVTRSTAQSCGFGPSLPLGRGLASLKCWHHLPVASQSQATANWPKSSRMISHIG